jgi:hypothetical protein
MNQQDIAIAKALEADMDAAELAELNEKSQKRSKIEARIKRLKENVNNGQTDITNCKTSLFADFDVIKFADDAETTTYLALENLADVIAQDAVNLKKAVAFVRACINQRDDLQRELDDLCRDD